MHAGIWSERPLSTQVRAYSWTLGQHNTLVHGKHVEASTHHAENVPTTQKKIALYDRGFGYYDYLC